MGRLDLVAAVMLLLTGTFNLVEGLAALRNDEAFVATDEGHLAFDLTTWGWIHLLFGATRRTCRRTVRCA